MELINGSGRVAGYTQGQDSTGRDYLIVVVKGTYAFPNHPNAVVQLAQTQQPLFEADIASGEPGLSAPIHETDYARYKPRCDVILNGSAYAPKEQPTERVTVGIRIGTWQKSFDVVGNRVWQADDLSIRASHPIPFKTMPISYNNAFGGVDDTFEDQKTYRENPIGCGYHHQLLGSLVDGQPLPNTEQTNHPITQPDGRYKPMAFGPIGRHWAPRYQLAGTYDQHWKDHIFPFLPPDFNDAYYQSAPDDQQIQYPQGGETIALLNLTPEGKTALKLPDLKLPIAYLLANGGKEETEAVVDTLTIEPDQCRLSLTWRISRPLQQDFFEIESVVVGRVSNAWWRAKTQGKDYYPSLGKLIRNGSDTEAGA